MDAMKYRIKMAAAIGHLCKKAKNSRYDDNTYGQALLGDSARILGGSVLGGALGHYGPRELAAHVIANGVEHETRQLAQKGGFTGNIDELMPRLRKVTKKRVRQDWGGLPSFKKYEPTILERIGNKFTGKLDAKAKLNLLKKRFLLGGILLGAAPGAIDMGLDTLNRKKFKKHNPKEIHV